MSKNKEFTQITIQVSPTVLDLLAQEYQKTGISRNQLVQGILDKHFNQIKEFKPEWLSSNCPTCDQQQYTCPEGVACTNGHTIIAGNDLVNKDRSAGMDTYQALAQPSAYSQPDFVDELRKRLNHVNCPDEVK